MPIYTLPSGEITRHPTTKDAARLANDPLYDPGEWCDVCGMTRYRYAKSDECLHCARLRAHAFYNLAVGALVPEPPPPDVLDLWESVRDEVREKELKIKPDACKTAGHVGLKASNGRCYFCQAEKPARKRAEPSVNSILMRDCPDLILSIEDARAMGYSVYRTGKPCKEGHHGYRYVASRNCVECARGR